MVIRSSKLHAPAAGHASALAGVLIGVLALVGCGVSSSPRGGPTSTPVRVGATVKLAAASFTQTSVTITAGDAVQFDDPAATGGPHMLCLGHNQVCNPSAAGPRLLSGVGFRILPGNPPISVVFATPGVYQVTCSLHPLMNLLVTVK